MADARALIGEVSWVRALAQQLVRDPEQADDLAQEAYLAALTSPDAELRAPRAWLGKVLRNQLWLQRRRERRRRHREVEAACDDHSPSTFDAVLADSVRRQVTEAVQALPAPYRQVLLWRYYEGWTPSEIAAREQIPVATVKTRLQRGLVRLRGELDRRHGGQREPWATAIGAWLAADSAGRVSTAAPAVGVAVVAGAAVVLLAAAGAWWMLASRPAGAVQRGRAIATALPAPAVAPAVAPAAAPAAPARAALAGSAHDVVVEALDPTAVRVAGRVIDLRGQPVSTLVRAPANSGVATAIAFTDGDGRFELEAADPRLTAIRPGPNHTALWVDRRTLSANLVEVTLVVAERRAVEGTVVALGGEPVSDALVEVVLPASLQAGLPAPLHDPRARRPRVLTGADGRFSLAAVPRCEGVVVQVWADGHETRRFAAVDVPPLIELRSLSAGGPAVAGAVVDSSGQPVAGARVTDGTHITRTGRTGSFALPWRAGPVELTAVGAGHQPARAAFSSRPTAGEALVLELGPAPRRIEGQVVDASGRPAVGAEVWIDDPTVAWATVGRADESLERCGEAALAEPTPAQPLVVENAIAGGGAVLWRPVITGVDGRFALEGLEDRAYRLAARWPGAGPIVRRDGIAAGARDVSIALIAPAALPPVRGRVVDQRGAPVAGARVRAQRTVFALARDGSPFWRRLELGDVARTGADGGFELLGVPPDANAVRVDGAGVLTAIRELAQRALPLEVQVDRRTMLRVDSPVVGDAVRLLTAAGEAVGAQSFEGDRRRSWRDVPLRGGSTGWFTAPAAAAFAVLLEGGLERQRAALTPTPSGRQVISFAP